MDSAQAARGFAEGEYTYSRLVGISAESFEEMGTNKAIRIYKRASDQRKFMQGWMHAHTVHSVLPSCMVLEVIDGRAGWRVGEKFWSNDYLLARREANKLQQCTVIPIEAFGSQYELEHNL